MKSPASAKGPRRWRWFWGLLFIFIAHAAAVFWFGERVKPPAMVEKTQPLLYIATDEATTRRLSELSAADPTLFALPSERGFSGEAWLKFTSADMSLTNWSAPPSWLPLDVNELGSTLALYAGTNRVSTAALLDGLRGTAPFELRVSSPPISVYSSFVIEGSLRSRKLSWTATLPFVTNSELVTNSVVELSVNGDGVVESVMLAGECGVKSMDERALSAARQFSFEPLDLARTKREAATPQRGRVVFTWHVVSPALTNGLTSNNSP
ncbi:MAG TPA: energy transducer TonB [Candidatus Acidoferrum sp.]|nr:energy transducer TonB [Candidatus Acidoferrum sp.]